MKMRSRARRLALLTAASIAIAASLVSAGGAYLRTTAAPTLYFMYSMNCTISIVDDSGKPVTSIAPGAYQVDIRTPIPFATLPDPPSASSPDMTACKGIPQFQLTGPGINLFTTMSAGCVEDMLLTETFQPNATYVAEDLNQPTIAHASFTTLASGTPKRPVVTYGGGKGQGQVSTDIVGSLALKGTLAANVTAKGTATLTKSGKPVATLTAGRYKFAVDDRDPKNTFKLLGPKSTSATILTKRSTTITLTAGKWTYYTSLRSVHYFRVTS
jgi:hypothetical protein